MDAVREQSGYFSGSLWIDDSSLVEEGAGKVAGLRFSGFPAICLLASPLLTLNPVPVAPQLPCTVAIYARGGQVSGAWSTLAPPPSIGALDPLRDFLVAELDLVAPGSALYAVALSVPALNSARNAGTTPGVSWDGLFAFHLHTRTQDGTDLFLNANTELFEAEVDTRVFTGIEIGGALTRMSQSRPDLCPICGDETLRETWVFCGYHERMECPRCADPGLGEEPSRGGSRFRLLGED